MKRAPDPAEVPVVAAVICRDGRYLLGRRPEHKRHGGLWEFPGGKVRDGEDVAAAMARELAEELGLAVRSLGRELDAVRDRGAPFRIHFVEVDALGEPEAHEHEAVGWYTPEELVRLDLAPADRRFVERLTERLADH